MIDHQPAIEISLQPHVLVSIHQRGVGSPPGYEGMATASCSTWLRFESFGPGGWWRPTLKSRHKITRWLQDCGGVLDVVRGCDLWRPALPAAPSGEA